jgi:hypothetical protein
LVEEFSKKLSNIKLTPDQQIGENINKVKSFLNQRADLENKAGEERITAFEKERDRILLAITETNAERIAIDKAT